jgi:hypothetical protein
VVVEQFPEVRAAWLAGSVVAGTATSTSDLDITVLLEGPPAPFRESLVHNGWPVELFVHSPETVQFWLDKDLARRRPTLARLIANGVTLVDIDGAAGLVAERCDEFLATGPGVLDVATPGRSALRPDRRARRPRRRAGPSDPHRRGDGRIQALGAAVARR